jgi:hypothetical protein
MSWLMNNIVILNRKNVVSSKVRISQLEVAAALSFDRPEFEESQPRLLFIRI